MSQSDVFRFAVLRQADTPPESPPIIEVLKTDENLDFIDGLIRLRKEGALEEILNISQEYKRSNNDFVTGLIDLDSRLAPLENRNIESKQFSEALQLIASKLSENELAVWKSRLAVSLTVAIVLGQETRQIATSLDRSLRIIELLRETKRDGKTDSKSLKRFLSRTMALPSQLFPLPLSKKNRDDLRKIHENALEEYIVKNEKRGELVQKLLDNQVGISELQAVYDMDYLSLSLDQSKFETKPVRDVRSSRSYGLFGGIFRRTQKLETIPATSFTMVKSELTETLSESTKNIVKRLGRDLSQLNVVDIISQIEKENGALANTLYKGGKVGKAVKLAGGFVLPDANSTNEVLGDFNTHVPGVCPPSPPENPIVATPSVPAGVGDFQSLGISDLMVVRQFLLRYETGEVAHIENVLRSEKRSREHRALSRTEIIEIEEVESSEEIEKDLESTERFELQIETEKTIESDANREAGITVSGSYGPTVEFSANAGFSSTNSASTTNLAATSHAREITDRAVQRIQERVRRERTTKTLSEVEVINKHGFKNQDPESANISGIYSWVDKVYQAQVFNYGKREIIEVIVPEPAALLKHLKSQAHPEGNSVQRPDEPGYCDRFGNNFEPLEPKYINAISYLFWASRYNVQGIEAPPPRYKVVGLAISSGAESETAALADNTLQIPDGYVAKRGVYTGTHTTRPSTSENAGMEVIVGRHSMSSGVITALNQEIGTMPIAIITANVPSFTLTVEIECEITTEAMDEWRLLTYNAIMEAYEELNAEYEAVLQRADEFDEQVSIQGRNPLLNREIERKELKRLAISQLTGHHFDDFDAMRRGVAPHGYPQVDLSEARLEGQYVRFIEQAFEWENMQYLFYPYFWGRKDKWPQLNQITDKDPLYEAFLTAGSSRINVPIRPGFESAANAFLSTGVLPWNTDTNSSTVTEDEPFLSIAEEMKAQQGPIGIRSEGVVSIDIGSEAVVGKETEFTEDDINREITLGGEIHIIKSVTDEFNLTLSRPYEGKVLVESPYVIGAKAVGVPWTVRIPTSLVFLQADDKLPSFT